MGMSAKTLLLALPLIAGCAALSQLSSQGAGTNPGGKATSSYNGPSISQKRAFERSERLENPRAIYQKANFRPHWIDRVPMEVRSWENGFNETLKDGTVTLSPQQRELMRETVSMFMYHDSRVNRDQLHSKLASLPDAQRVDFMVQRIDEVRRDALAHAGIRNPSRELHQYSWGLAASQWTAYYSKWDDNVGSDWQKRIKRNTTPAEALLNPVHNCTGQALLSRDLIRSAARTIPELGGLKALCQGLSLFGPDRAQSGGHALVATQISGKYVHFFDPVAFSNPDTYPRGRPTVAARLSRMGPLDEATVAYSASIMCVDLRAPRPKVEGDPPAQFNVEFVGGDRPGSLLSLGSEDRRLIRGVPHPNRTAEEQRLMATTLSNGRPALMSSTEWHNWRTSTGTTQKLQALLNAIGGE
jgi:hypothetical protein